MIFGNASWGFRETPLEQQLAATKRIGLSVLELGIANAPNDLPLDITDEQIKDVVDLYEKYNIQLVCAATGNDFGTDPLEQISKIKKVIDICSKLKIKYLRIFASFLAVEEVKDEVWEEIISALNEADKYAEQKNVILVVETHGSVKEYNDGVVHFHSMTTDEATIKKMLNSISDRIMFCYDPANLFAVGIKRPIKVFNVIKERVSVVHLKDFVTLPSGHLKPSACGESEMDWKEVLSSLESFNGYGLFEYENVEDVEQGCARCYQYITRTIDEQSTH